MTCLSKLAVTRAVAVLMIAAIASPAFAEEISGVPSIHDGDTVKIRGTKIRLSGIDAPETDQLCLDAKGQKWACGIAARDELIKHSSGQSWDCDLGGEDGYKRRLGICSIDRDNVNRWMVRSGWAMSFKRYSHAYD